IPLISNSVNHLLNMFLGSFGLATRGTTAPKIDIDPDGKLRFYPVTEEFRAMLRYLRDLYANKLIYQEIFDVTTPIVTALGEQNLLFMSIFNIRDYIGQTNKDAFGGIFEPFIGPTGEQAYNIRSNPISLQNTFISTTNAYPAETVAMIDYLYSDEGVRMYFMGFEDITYTYDAEGRVVYSDLVTNNPEGLGKEEVLGMYVPWAGGRNPSMAEDRYLGYNMSPPLEQSITASLLQYAPKEVWGTFNYSEADSTRLSTLSTDISTYLSESQAKFITGNLSLDTDWDAYVATLQQIGLAELMEIYQRGLDTYEAASK
ncbi:MAG TPA: hypothetical protein PKE04_21330, partial [Clostridia bacterium]|nr:hypothetical protein [Clostridia bacterium]